MDSLIMYGMVSAFKDVEYRVVGTAGEFEIEVEGADVDGLARLLASSVYEHKEAIVGQLVDELRLVQRSSRRGLEGYLNALSDPSTVARNLRSYERPGHAQNEGRGASGQHVWLPLFPHLGKYLTREYRYSPSKYGACPFCVALACLGFHKATIPVRFRPPENGSLVMLLSFEGEVPGETLTQMLGYFVDYASSDFITNVLRPFAHQLPLSTFTFAILANLSKEVIGSLYESRASWTAISVRFAVERGQVAQVRGYEEASVDRLASSLARLMRIDEELRYGLDPLERVRRVTERLMRMGEVTALEALYKFMVTRAASDLYTATRQMFKATGEGLGVRLCEELARLAHSA